MIIIGGELWITARESAVRAGRPQHDLRELARRGKRAAREGREEGLSPVLVPSPPGCPWATEYAWPERIWVSAAWEDWLDRNMWRR